MLQTHTFRTRISRKATPPEKAIWIIVSVIGNGKLKYNVERTHCNKPMVIKGKRLSKIY